MEKKCLAIGIIILFFGMCVIPTSAKNIEKSQSISKGNWLYVGGNGPENYTKIQDAIDNASDGDTVFVFDDSSPYRENIVINTSISLFGEDKNTTIIDGTNKSNTVNITADNVTIMRFTIQNGNNSGIFINSNNNRITDTLLSNNLFGISTSFGEPFQSSQNNTITNNRLIHNGVGITFWGGKNNIITGNIISQSGYGIYMIGIMNINMSFNIVSENEIGVFIMIAYNTMIYRNNITNNSNFGLLTAGTNADKILQNNFIGNNMSAISSQWFPSGIKMWKTSNLPIFRRNVWKGNYWDEPRSLPYMIPGILVKLRFHFDWHPAQEPYDIPGMT
jgi:parallel beta-helix repeat protein